MGERRVRDLFQRMAGVIRGERTTDEDGQRRGVMQGEGASLRGMRLWNGLTGRNRGMCVG